MDCRGDVKIKSMADQPLQQPEYFPAEPTTALIQGPAGQLEIMTEQPEVSDAWNAVAVLCHPHPLHGGTMHNKVVHMMERSVRELGLKTVRLNFRGVGLSEGEFDNGFGETNDLIAVTEWAQSVLPDHELWLGGFSFGSYVAVKGAQQLPVKQMISIAPPVERYDFVALPRPDCPWLVVQGDEDEVVAPAAVYDWIDGLEDPPQLVKLEGAGHFFHRRLMDLRGVIKNGVRRQRDT